MQTPCTRPSHKQPRSPAPGCPLATTLGEVRQPRDVDRLLEWGAKMPLSNGAASSIRVVCTCIVLVPLRVRYSYEIDPAVAVRGSRGTVRVLYGR